MNAFDPEVILIFSADSAAAAPIAVPLGQAGFVVVESLSTDAIPALLSRWRPRMAIVDWNLPDSAALAVIRAIRTDAQFSRIAVVLTGTEIHCEDKVFLLESMIDYCLDGPVFPHEWIARVRAILRRTPKAITATN